MKSVAIDRRQPVARGFYCAAALVLIAATGGCGSFTSILPGEKENSPSDKKPVATGTQVRASGDGFALGDVERATLSPQQFVDRMGEYLRGGKMHEARRLGPAVPRHGAGGTPRSEVGQHLVRHPGGNRRCARPAVSPRRRARLGSRSPRSRRTAVAIQPTSTTSGGGSWSTSRTAA